MRKILLLTNIISPYRIPLFNYISNIDNFSFKVIALANNEKNRQWQINKKSIEFHYEVLPGFHFFSYSKSWGIHINYGLTKKLLKYNPDIIIISGYDNLAYWQALLYAKLFNKKCIFWNGSTLLSSNQNSGIIAKLKKVIINSVDRYITYGTKAKEYLESYGVDEDDISVGVNTVDIQYYNEKVDKYRKTKQFELERKKYPKLLLLFVGQLIKRKGIKELLVAINKMNSEELGLIVVGDGPLKSKLEDFCQDNQMGNIYFEGFVQRNNIYKYYALADCLVVPSYEEVWGLVVNEGLASGNFILASDQVGAAYDVLNDNNGLIFNTDNMVNQLIRSINYCLKDRGRIVSKRNFRSQYAIANLIISKYGEAFKDCIKSL